MVPPRQTLLAVVPLVLKAKAPALFVVAIAMARSVLAKLQLLLGLLASRCPVPSVDRVAITAP